MAKKDDYMSLAYKRAGGFDRSAYNSERKSAKSKYNTNLKSLKNEYNNFISSINSQREKNDNAFTRGRSAISEDAYFANRQSLQDLASRGLSGGLAQLNKVANDTATNRQYSDLANDYYNTADELDTSQKNADDQYALDKESLRNDYESLLANIKARENSDYMNYKQRVASLAESIQNRMYQEQKDTAIANKKYVTGIKSQYNMKTPQGVIDAANRAIKDGYAKNMYDALYLLYDNDGFNKEQIIKDYGNQVLINNVDPSKIKNVKYDEKTGITSYNPKKNAIQSLLDRLALRR